ETFAEHVAKPPIEGPQFSCLADACPIGRVDEDEAGGTFGRREDRNRLAPEPDKISDSRALGIGATCLDGARVAIEAGEAETRILRPGLGLQRRPVSGIEIRQRLECKTAPPPRIEPGRDLRSFEQYRSRTAHRIKDRFASAITAFAQEKRGERLAQGRLADRLLRAPPMQRITRGVEADRAEILDDTDEDAHLRITCHPCAGRVLDRTAYPLGCGSVMPDPRALAGGIHPDCLHRAQHRTPVESACPLVELRKMDGMEGAKPDEHPPCPAQPQICTPDLRP